MGKPKARGNGQGTAYKRKNSSTWTASVVVGWRIPKDDSKQNIPIKRTKAGFKTKKEALQYCEILRNSLQERKHMTLQEVFDEWKEKYANRIVASTMAGYVSAYKHFSAFHNVLMENISAQNLQDCMDACAAGKRTHQVMKVIAGLLWGYAFDSKYIDRDITKNLYTGKGKSEQRDPITEEEVECCIISNYSDEIVPDSPSQRGVRGFNRFLFGTTAQMIQTRLEQTLSVTPQDVHKAAERLLEYSKNCRKFVICDKSKDFCGKVIQI